jgi:hypothetical protein
MAQLVEALCYKTEGCGFDSQWCHWNFSLTSFLALGLIHPLTEMSTRDNSWWGKGGRRVGLKPYYLHVLIVLKSVSLKLLEPSGPVQACNGTGLLFTFYPNSQNILLIHTKVDICVMFAYR